MRSTMASIPLALAIALCGSAVFAQEVASFTHLSACRVDAGRILVRATFDGSACWEVGPASLTEPRGTAMGVHLPTISTAEICTMQIVPFSTEQVIDAPEPVIDLQVAAADPQNNIVAEGVIQASEGEQDCLPVKG
jgi:hypothetical protein